MKTLAWIIIIVLVGYGIYWFANRDDGGVVKTTDNTSTTTPPVEPKTVTVTYGTDGFNPSTVTIKKGDSITFVNQSSRSMWVGSAMHPTHEVYDGTALKDHCVAGATPSFDQCKDVPNGGSYSFIFNKAGSWGYHNHSTSSHYGKVVVE